MANKFGVREVCNVLFEKQSGIGPDRFVIDTAKMTSIEGASTTVYAQGGLGNSRLMAWEGEKTITFTLEDALLTMDSLWALTGADHDPADIRIKKFDIKTTSFAGIYKITAKTLFRDDTGVDRVATITIPKAKLQSNLNITMSPSGDPSTFTYTFDALADVNKTLFTLEIDMTNNGNIDDVGFELPTIVIIDGEQYTAEIPAGATKLILAINENLSEGTSYGITLKGDDASKTPAETITKTLAPAEYLSNLVNEVLKPGSSVDIKLGTTTTWYII